MTGRTNRVRSAFSAAIIGLSLASTTAHAQSQTFRPEVWIPNGTIRAFGSTGETLYIGGSFDFVGHPTGGWGMVDDTTGDLIPGLPSVNRAVNAVAPDGAGGWYIGGEFSRVGPVAQPYLAHILPDGTVDPSFNPAPDNYVHALAVIGDSLYIGGRFGTIGGQTRTRLASINLLTGAVTPWNPAPTGTLIDRFQVSGTILYLTGGFGTILGQSRTLIAGIETTTGQLTPFNPLPNTSIHAFAVSPSGSTVYIGGAFSIVGDSARTNAAAVDATTNQVLNWKPEPNDWVEALAVTDDGVYAGGYFTFIGGESRARVARLNTTNGNATAWDPDPDNLVLGFSFGPSGSPVYVSGQFSAIGGASRARIAALDSSSGSALSWNPGAGGVAHDMIALPGRVLVHGGFLSISGVTRNGLAAIDLKTGEATSWDPDLGPPNASVDALAIDGGTVYAGGTFTSAGGQGRQNLAAIDATTALATSWNPGPDDAVRDIAIRDSTVYVAGRFLDLDGLAVTRHRLAAFARSTGVLRAWDPDLSGEVNAVQLAESTLFAVGSFATAGGQARQNVAEIDLAGGAPTSWAPGTVNGVVYDLALDGGMLYIGGSFSTAGGLSRMRLAAYDRTTGGLSTWVGPAVGTECASALPRALEIVDSLIYVTGQFSGLGGIFREGVGAIRKSNGTLASWYPGRLENYGGCPTGLALLADADALYLGGDIISVADNVRNGFAVFPREAGPVQHPPAQPANVLPEDGGIDIVLAPTLTCTSFSDPDAGDTHAVSQWQVTDTPGNYSSPVFDSGADAGHLTAIPVIPGALDYGTTYAWHARHRDNAGNWSTYSDETSFTTLTAGPPIPALQIAVHQHPIFSSHAEIVVISDIGLGNEPDLIAWLEDSSDSTSVTMTAIEDATVFRGAITFDVSGTYHLRAEAESDDGVETSEQRNFSALVLDPGMGSALRVPGGEAELRIPSRAVTTRTCFLLSVGEASGDHDVIQSVEMGPDREFDPALGITLLLPEGAASETVRLERREGAAWVAVPATISASGRSVSAEVTRLGAFRLVRAGADGAGVAVSTRFTSLRPNPFRSDLTISYEIASPHETLVEIFNLAGRRVASLAPAHRAGRHTVSWNGRDEEGRALPSGVYWVRMRTGGSSLAEKVLLVR